MSIVFHAGSWYLPHLKDLYYTEKKSSGVVLHVSLSKPGVLSKRESYETVGCWKTSAGYRKLSEFHESSLLILQLLMDICIESVKVS